MRRRHMKAGVFRLLAACIMSVLALTACTDEMQNADNDKNVEDVAKDTENMNVKEKGGKVDHSYNAPKTIESKAIESFETDFYIIDKANEKATGGYSYVVSRNADGELVLEEKVHDSISVTIDEDFLDRIQAVIDDNGLVAMNGTDSYTRALPEEYAPCMMKVVYKSGEMLYFHEDNNPEAKWAADMAELFREEFVRQGHEELLPPKDDVTLVRFDMQFRDEEHEGEYNTIFTSLDTGEFSEHYMRNFSDSEKTIDGIISAVPGDFYEKLYEKLLGLGVEKYGNDTIYPGGLSETECYASFCMEMQSGKQLNAFYEGEEARELITLFDEVTVYIDSVLG